MIIIVMERESTHRDIENTKKAVRQNHRRERQVQVSKQIHKYATNRKKWGLDQ